MIIDLALKSEPRSCHIEVARGVTSKLPDILVDYDRALVIHDAALEDLAQSVADPLGLTRIAVEGGEAAKTLSRIEDLAAQLLAVGLSRRSLLINLGGGVISDLGGFLASVYMRGIDFVHLPTTLLGMCDAAVGGKTGVDLGAEKNMIGSFAQPRAVLADPKWLETLPDDRLREGFAEALKMAAMLDASEFEWFESEALRLLAREAGVLDLCVEKAVALKARVVQDDEREAGKRAWLNFGHTVGHAIEAESAFAIHHGDAVAMGMLLELAMVDSALEPRLRALLEALELPIKSPISDGAALWERMTRDKKASAGEVRLAVPETLGRGRLATTSRASLEAALLR